MGSTTTALWLIADWTATRRLPTLLAASTAIAVGMMTKGPIALMVPVFCFGSHWVLRREWNLLFRPVYLLGLALIALLVLPMSIGLYQQFDLHPEKMVNGQTQVSGLRFFYWSQSFGRITGESPWDNGAPFSFLFENMLWGFLPWILLFVAAIVYHVSVIIRSRGRLSTTQEAVTTGGFFLTYFVLGSSRYQLPHYLFIAFPLAAIMVASMIRDMALGAWAPVFCVLKSVQVGLSVLLLCVAALTFLYVFYSPLWLLPWAAGVIVWVVVAFRGRHRWLWLPVVSILLANVVMTHHFYHTLLGYQLGSQVPLRIAALGLPAAKLSFLETGDPLNSLHFYAGRVVPGTDLASDPEGSLVLAGKAGLDSLHGSGRPYTAVDSGRFFKVSELTPQFLNPATRDSATKVWYLVSLK
jgi:4-amino-4-deoxy-L-arabinose transferase-like glycosyltransferase